MKTPTKKQWYSLLRSFFPFYSEEKLRLAFEYGLSISETAHEMKVELTPEIVTRGEDILVDVCSYETAQDVAVNMVPNILATFEPKEDN